MNHWRVPPQKIRHRETKKFKKVVVVCYPKFFRYQKLSELQGSSYETFWYCEKKTINKIVIPVLSKKFWNQNNSETQAGWPTMICGDVRQKKDKIVIPLLSKIFWYQNVSETQEGAPTMFFGDLGPKKLRREKVTPHLLSINFFRAKTFLKDKSVPPRSFSVLRD